MAKVLFVLSFVLLVACASQPQGPAEPVIYDFVVTQKGAGHQGRFCRGEECLVIDCKDAETCKVEGKIDTEDFNEMGSSALAMAACKAPAKDRPKDMPKHCDRLLSWPHAVAEITWQNRCEANAESQFKCIDGKAKPERPFKRAWHIRYVRDGQKVPTQHRTIFEY